MDGSLLSPASPLLNALTPRCGHRKLSAKDTDDCGRCHVVGARRRSQLDKWGRLRRRKRSKHVNTAAVGVLGGNVSAFLGGGAEGTQEGLTAEGCCAGRGPGCSRSQGAGTAIGGAFGRKHTCGEESRHASFMPCVQAVWA